MTWVAFWKFSGVWSGGADTGQLRAGPGAPSGAPHPFLGLTPTPPPTLPGGLGGCSGRVGNGSRCAVRLRPGPLRLESMEASSAGSTCKADPLPTTVQHRSLQPHHARLDGDRPQAGRVRKPGGGRASLFQGEPTAASLLAPAAARSSPTWLLGLSQNSACPYLPASPHPAGAPGASQQHAGFSQQPPARPSAFALPGPEREVTVTEVCCALPVRLCCSAPLRGLP